MKCGENLNKYSPIGIFDSGMGGISVLKECIKLMPYENYIYYGDSKNAPYGIKSNEDIIKYSTEICNFLVSKGVKAIIIACNTATSVSVKILREKFSIPIIGMEPAVKPALVSANKKILVLATDVTLKEKKLKNLIEKYDKNNFTVKIPCAKLVEIVENGLIDDINTEKIIKDCFKNINFNNVSTIVLGCTHFIFLKKNFESILGKSINIIDGNYGTVKNLKNILEKNNLLNNSDILGNVEILNSSDDLEFLKRSKELLKISL